MANLLNPMPLPFEPKRKNRFFMRFPSELGIAEWTLVSASRPKVTVNATEIPFLNTSTWVAGRFNWETINVTLKDPIGPSSAQAVMEWVRLCAETVTGRMGYAAGYKKDVYLEMLDPTGVGVEKWLLQGTFIADAGFGDLSYSDDAVAEISLTLRPDRCILLY